MRDYRHAVIYLLTHEFLAHRTAVVGRSVAVAGTLYSIRRRVTLYLVFAVRHEDVVALRTRITVGECQALVYGTICYARSLEVGYQLVACHLSLSRRGVVLRRVGRVEGMRLRVGDHEVHIPMANHL